MLKETPRATGGQPYQATGTKLAPVEPTLADIPSLCFAKHYGLVKVWGISSGYE